MGSGWHFSVGVFRSQIGKCDGFAQLVPGTIGVSYSSENVEDLLYVILCMTELRYTLRALFKKPGLALAAIVCLAIGIGANTAIYTVVNAVVLRPLPFKNAERLARIYTEFPSYGSS